MNKTIDKRRKTKKFNSKRKGNNAERKVADFFNRLFSFDKESGFRRTPLSGGWSKQHAADLTYIEGFKYLVEIKNKESISFDALFRNPLTNELLKDFKQSERAVRRFKTINDVKVYPMLIFTKNNHPYYVMIRESKITCGFKEFVDHIIFRFSKKRFLIFKMEELLKIPENKLKGIFFHE